MKRRTVITAAVALPCIGVARSATAATGNATDAAWAAYEAGRARYAKNDQAYDAFEATIPIGSTRYPEALLLDGAAIRTAFRILSRAWRTFTRLSCALSTCVRMSAAAPSESFFLIM